MIYNFKNPFFTEYMFYLKVEFFNKIKQWNFVKNVMVLNMGNNQRFWYVLKHEDQQWLVCVPLGIHLEPINKTLKLLVTIKERTVLHQIRSSLGQWCAIKILWTILFSCFNNRNDTLFGILKSSHSYSDTLAFIRMILYGRGGGVTSDISQS